MPSRARYHHGDLRATLLREAGALLREQGIEGLSLRRLAERAGVSRTAPYHHFQDKNALLCALAETGFQRLDRLLMDSLLVEPINLGHPGQEAALRGFVRAYLDFAVTNPEQYELMFGRTLWKAGQPSDSLKQVAHTCFRRFVERFDSPTQRALLPTGTEPLRVAQASWATLHGLCRLLLDGIYLDIEDMEAVSDQAVRLMLAGLNRPLER